MTNNKLFLDIIEAEKKLNELNNFKDFLEMYSEEKSKDKFYEINSQLNLNDFTELIDKYIEDDNYFNNKKKWTQLY